VRCGRRSDPFAPDFPGEDTWREGGNPYHMSPTCSYCGSITPEALFAAIEAGHEIGPTDKNYKLYVEVPTADPTALRVTGGSSGGDEPPSWGERSQWHRYADLTDEQRAMLRRDGWGDGEREGWVMIAPVGPTAHGKFYFQHFDGEQQGRFLDLVNAGKVNFGYPGHLYVRPYFAYPGQLLSSRRV
jgi:hypothetical protein